MKRFDFDIDVDTASNIEYRFRGSWVFNENNTPLYVLGVRNSVLHLDTRQDDEYIDLDPSEEPLYFGIPEHGWMTHRGRILHIKRAFPERKWKYGYEPSVDTCSEMHFSSINALAKGVTDKERDDFIKGSGVLTRSIASKDGRLFCDDLCVGNFKEGVYVVPEKFDFLLYDFAEYNINLEVCGE